MVTKMLCTWLILILIPFTSGNLLIEKEDNKFQVLAVAHGHGVVAVATKNEILVTSGNGKVSGRIKLPFLERTLYLELKVFSVSEIFYCDDLDCGLCTYSSGKESCSSVDFKSIDEEFLKLTSAAVVLPFGSEQMLLRVSYNKVGFIENALILRLDAKDNGKLQPHSKSQDATYLTEHKTVLSFERKNFVYFIVSAVQPYEPLANLNKHIFNASLTKITRLCTKDQTDDLASKMSIVVGCGSKEDALTTEARAAYFDDAGDVLTVVMKNGTGLNHNICKFKMDDIEKRFNGDWDMCQKTTISDGHSCEYSKKLEDFDEKPFCYIFSHMARDTTVCSRFGGNGQLLENCDLHNSVGNKYRYGSLEDYDPYIGELIMKFPQTSVNEVHAVIPDDQAYYLTGSVAGRASVFRARPSKTAEAIFLWQTNVSSPSHLSISKINDGSPLRVAYVQGLEVGSVTSTCRSLYSKCDLLDDGGWDDPMECIWCAAESSSYSVRSSDADSCPKFAKSLCPPQINKAIMFSNRTGMSFFGRKMNSMPQPEVFICGIPCEIYQLDGREIHCKVGLRSSFPDGCKDVEIAGRLGDVKRYSVRTSVTSSDAVTQSDGPAVSESSKSSKTWKAAIAVLAVLLLVVIVTAIVYFMRSRVPKMHSNGRIPMGMPNDYTMDTLQGSSRSTDVSRLPEFINYLSIYETFDESLKIDFTKLTVDKDVLLGKGNFGVVYKGVFEANDTKIDVACKYLRNGRVSEFYAEAQIMAQLNHPHVVKCYGIALENTRTPVTVTQLMSNKDLHAYIHDETNIVTLATLFRFAQEIASGMAYIHSRGYIHRDLAARNCMLDSNLRAYIADFGFCRKLDEETRNYAVMTPERDLPLRWMPPEILDDIYGYPCDVWSFGVVLWELTTRGHQPYLGTKLGDIPNCLRQGLRLSRPNYCPLALYDLMMACWEANPEDRPTFVQLLIDLQRVLEQLRNEEVSRLNKVYEKVSPRFPTPVAVNRTPSHEEVPFLPGHIPPQQFYRHLRDSN